MRKILYFDLVCGASGDMILSSLIDLGVPLEFIREKMNQLAIPGLSIIARQVMRSGIGCVQLELEWEPAHEHRHIKDILGILGRGRFDDRVMSRCELVLDRLATAESKVHGVPKDHVHFHEIGAIDTIIDVAGASLAIEYLKPDHIFYSTLTVGHGTIQTAHGVMPVPVPATSAMSEGLHMTTLDIATEILTPTGCAILTACGEQRILRPAGRIIRVGQGCGTKVFEKYPNLLRTFLMESDDEGETGNSDTIVELETDLDHLSGEVMGHVAGLLMEQGALDVSWTPIYMKKGRPGYRLTVLALPREREALCSSILINTRTLGIRVQLVSRIVAEREFKKIDFMGHPATEKICSWKGYTFRKLEYEALAALSREKDMPLPDVMEQYIRERTG